MLTRRKQLSSWGNLIKIFPVQLVDYSKACFLFYGNKSVTHAIIGLLYLRFEQKTVNLYSIIFNKSTDL